MVNTYKLTNPYIQGDFKSKIKAKNSKEAASIFYKNLSEHFNNAVPSFHFTIQKGSSGLGSYYHFKVSELRKNDEVNYSIEPIKINNEQNVIKSFNKKLENFKSKFLKNQDGGKHHKKKKYDDSSSDSSSDSDFIYKKVKKHMPVSQPIYYWWYDPYIYDIDTVFIPTFYSYITPYIQYNMRP